MTEPPSPTLDLAGIEAAAKAATPGKWSVTRKQVTQRQVNGGRGDWASFVVRPGDPYGVAIYTPCTHPNDSSPEGVSADARFIAAASPDVVLALVARLRAAEARLSNLRAALETIDMDHVGKSAGRTAAAALVVDDALRGAK